MLGMVSHDLLTTYLLRDRAPNRLIEQAGQRRKHMTEGRHKGRRNSKCWKSALLQDSPN